MSLVVSCKETGGGRTLAQLQFSKINMQETKTLGAAKLVEAGNAPAAVRPDDCDILKYVTSKNGSYLVTKHTICKSTDYTLSCQFKKPDGSLATIVDVKSFPSKSALLVMFDDMQLSAVPEDLGYSGEEPGDFYYISPMAEAMQEYKMPGAYSYQETNGYAFIAAKQDAAAHGLDCDEDISNQD